MVRRFSVLAFLVLAILAAASAQAEILTTANVKIEWKVVNRFRFFRDPDLFKLHETAWRQYGQHVNAHSSSAQEFSRLYAESSVLGTEHMLNDRRIPFTDILRSKFDWRGWAAGVMNDTCWDAKSRQHSACGTVENYVNPKAHDIEISLQPLASGTAIAEYNCQWRVGNNPPMTAPCDETVKAVLPFPTGATISVNVEGERAISIDAKVKDLLIVGFGDSFASGEGNPDSPVRLDENLRTDNFYPARTSQNTASSAQWMDQLCHRSLYGHQLRTALQIAVENLHGAVTFMGYACSGAAVAKGVIGPQSYVEYVSQSSSSKDPAPIINAVSGGRQDNQIYWFLREICKTQVQNVDGNWQCEGQQFRRDVDLVLVSVGGNDIGFANLVGWATLRDGASSKLAQLFGQIVSANQFADNMKNLLPDAYQKLARALEKAVPLRNGDMAFDPARVILTAYPDILADETGRTCAGVGAADKPEDFYAANQSLDRFASWLVVADDKLAAAHAQLGVLHKRMGELAEANGWTYAGRAYSDEPFRGHGFCAQRKNRSDDPAEILLIPCWGKSTRPSQTCQAGILGQGTGWRPYDPAQQNYPYALRQRWVRSFNDAFMVMNQKVVDRFGAIDERASSSNFSETTGAMHPNAEGQAAMADAILLDLRPELAKIFAEDQ